MAQTQILCMGGLKEQGEWGQKGQGAGSIGPKRPGSREQKKVISGAGSRGFWVLCQTMPRNSCNFSMPRFAQLILSI